MQILKVWESQETFYARYLQGRNLTGNSGDAGKLHHLVPNNYLPSFSPALCGAKPGRTSGGWSDYRQALISDSNDQVVCEKCKLKFHNMAVKGEL